VGGLRGSLRGKEKVEAVGRDKKIQAVRGLEVEAVSLIRRQGKGASEMDESMMIRDFKETARI
jgi:hypothetical protein